jgi:probable AcnD-accessory protein PrpF
MSQLRIPAIYMRGGTSKGVFFRAEDLPPDPRERDRILLRVIGSPDPYGKQIDGMGAATSSTSKIVILSPSKRPDSDVDYLFGQVAIDRPLIDWSGNCGNLTAAVGPFAVSQGWVKAAGPAPRGAPWGPEVATVRIWQQNIGKRIVAHVPVRDGEVVEDGDFELDGVTFPAAEIVIEFMDPGGVGDDAMFPTGRLRDVLDVPGVGRVEATLITAGNPTVFVDEGLGWLDHPEKAEAIRAHGAVAMGLAATPQEASTSRLHTPKIAFVAPPRDYIASSGKPVKRGDIDLTIRMLSMGKLHHAVTGTGAIATGVACAIPGTVAHDATRGAGDPLRTRIGHPSGTIAVGAEVAQEGREWVVTKAVMSRSARRLMEGWVRVPKG